MANESSVIVGSGVSVLREPEVQNVPRMRGTNSVVINYEDVNSLLGIAQSSGLAVGTSAIQLTGPENRLRGRRQVIIQNLGSGNIYLGGDASVTTFAGLEIAANTSLTLHVLDYGNLWVVADALADVRVMELR
jgi:hypothetical protein